MLMRFILIALLVCAETAYAQEWPSRPIRLVVGFGAGGGTDILARIVAPPLGKALGQPVTVDNRPGSGGTLAAREVAGAAPDGYTAFLLNNGHAVGAVIYKSLPYDSVGDFQPISMIATMPLVLLAGPDAPFHTLRGLIAEAKQSPGKLAFASVGAGSTQHFAGMLLLQLAGASMAHQPYDETPRAIAATRAGQAQLLVEVAAAVADQTASGALKALAVTSAHRFPKLRDVPTVAESGIPAYDVDTWYALAFPRKTSAPIVEKMRGALQDVLKQEAVQAQMERSGYMPQTSTSDALMAHVRAEIVRWTLVRDMAGIRPR